MQAIASLLPVFGAPRMMRIVRGGHTADSALVDLGWEISEHRMEIERSDRRGNESGRG